jgi:hypothetical protein
MVKYLRVRMEDNSLWDIPASIIAEDRATYYAKHDIREPDNILTYDEIFKAEFGYTLEDGDEIIDWAVNNMNWSDVEKYAVKVRTVDVDYQEGWMNGEKEVIEK